MTREIGKPLAESLGEVQEVVDTCDFFLGEGRRLYGQTVPSEMPDKQLFTYRNPVGVAVIVTAPNFPVAVPSWYLVPALLCGNAVVWKPAESTPAVAAGVHGAVPGGRGARRRAHDRGGRRPDDVRGARHDARRSAWSTRSASPARSAVGSAIGELCGRHLQSPCLELGGKNPMLVMADADLDLAVEGALFSGFGTSGQRCTSLGTVWAQREVYDDFRERFVAAVEDAVVGDPTQPVLYGPMISERYLDTHLRNLALVRDHHTVLGSTGIGRITSDNPRKGFVGDPDRGVYAHPTIVEGVRPGDELYDTGDVRPAGRARRASTPSTRAIALANGHGYGLSSSIYTRDPETVWRFRAGIGAGMVSVNNSTSGAEAHLPFGGNGRSGNGSRQSGIWVLDQFTRWQALNWDWSGHLQKAQMDVVETTWDPGFRL